MNNLIHKYAQIYEEIAHSKIITHKFDIYEPLAFRKTILELFINLIHK